MWFYLWDFHVNLIKLLTKTHVIAYHGDSQQPMNEVQVMGYQTDFRGHFELNKKLDQETSDFLVKFSETRHEKDRLLVVSGWPAIWCQWIPTEDGKGIEWDGAEKFYNYVEWIKYLIANVLAPKGYVLSGSVDWRGEEWEDVGTISIKDNNVEEIPLPTWG